MGLHLALLLLAVGSQSVAQAAYLGPYFIENYQLPFQEGQSMQEWQTEAKLNVSMWRNKIFARTMQVTKQLHESRVKGIPLQPLEFAMRHTAAADDKQPATTKAGGKGSNNHLYAEHPRAQAMFQLANPFITCPPPGKVNRVGGKYGEWLSGKGFDGQKYLCNIDNMKDKECVVLSIGSRGDTSFEEAILGSTSCTIVTLDCTMKEPLKTLGDRHKFYPLCLGSAEQAKVNPLFISLPQLMEKIGKKRADILKMDIEGWEWDVLAGFGTEPGYEDSLPDQLAIEFHVVSGAIYRNSPAWNNRNEWNTLLWPLHNPTFSQFQLLLLHMVDLGYGIVSRDDNPFAGSCTELVFQRVSM